MAKEMQLINQILENFEQIRTTFDLLNEKVEVLEKIIDLNEKIQGKRIAELEYKLEQLSDGHVFIEHMGLVGYQHKMQIMGKQGFSIERKDTHSELTFINTSKNIGD